MDNLGLAQLLTNCYECQGSSDGIVFFPSGCEPDEQGDVVSTSSLTGCIELSTGL